LAAMTPYSLSSAASARPRRRRGQSRRILQKEFPKKNAAAASTGDQDSPRRSAKPRDKECDPASLKSRRPSRPIHLRCYPTWSGRTSLPSCAAFPQGWKGPLVCMAGAVFCAGDPELFLVDQEEVAEPHLARSPSQPRHSKKEFRKKKKKSTAGFAAPLGSASHARKTRKEKTRDPKSVT